MEIKILGICGSPIKEGNTEALLREALKAVEAPGVTTDLISLRGKNIRDCLHCNWCIRKQTEGQYCNQHDDMYEIYPKVIEADGLLLASPVYFNRLSGYLAVMLDRFRCLGHGNLYHRALQDKVGGALVVSWYRNAGVETALLSIVSGFLAGGMLIANPGLGLGSSLGAVGLSTDDGKGKFDPKNRVGVLKDEYGVASARQLAQRAVEMARLIKAGKEALKAQAVS